MRMRDEDAQINITLLEFLKQQFDIQIYGLNPPPMDEHGLDMPKIFAIVRRAVMNLSMWDVVEAGFIGNVTCISVQRLMTSSVGLNIEKVKFCDIMTVSRG